MKNGNEPWSWNHLAFGWGFAAQCDLLQVVLMMEVIVGRRKQKRDGAILTGGQRGGAWRSWAHLLRFLCSSRNLLCSCRWRGGGEGDGGGDGPWRKREKWLVKIQQGQNHPGQNDHQLKLPTVFTVVGCRRIKKKDVKKDRTTHVHLVILLFLKTSSDNYLWYVTFDQWLMCQKLFWLFEHKSTYLDIFMQIRAFLFICEKRPSIHPFSSKAPQTLWETFIY